MDKLLRSGGPEDSKEVEINHDRIRRAVEGTHSPSEQKTLHYRLAVAFEALATEPDDGQLFGRPARHYEQAGNDETAGKYFALAAAAATGRLDFPAAGGASTACWSSPKSWQRRSPLSGRTSALTRRTPKVSSPSPVGWRRR
jgi:hypothetical protein